MNKNLSITSLIAMVLFMAATFATGTSQATFVGADKFGFPFTFFSATNNGEVINDTNFSLIALIGNLGICFAIAFGIVSLLSMFKVEKKKSAVA